MSAGAWEVEVAGIKVRVIEDNASKRFRLVPIEAIPEAGAEYSRLEESFDLHVRERGLRPGDVVMLDFVKLEGGR